MEILGEHPVLVDIAISRLERAGLCLKSKGDALRRWIRIPPDAAPPIQTRIQYFKLNYLDGKITEAKVYIEQSPHLLHPYFNNYDRPLYVEFILKEEENTLPIGTAMKYLYDCEYNGVRRKKIDCNRHETARRKKICGNEIVGRAVFFDT